MRNGRNLREHSMPSNRWVVLGLLFAVRVSTGIQYQAVASLSPQLMSGFVLRNPVKKARDVCGDDRCETIQGQTQFLETMGLPFAARFPSRCLDRTSLRVHPHLRA